MRLLAIETTRLAGSVAALEGGSLLAEVRLPEEQRAAQSLAPGLKGLLEQVGWEPADVELVAVTVGPGSFTGLRVGVTTAKTFAYAVQAGIIGVDTLEAIAAGVPEPWQTVSAAVDAQRGDVVAGLFRRGPDGWLSPVGPSKLVSIHLWLAALEPGTLVAGPVEKLSGASCAAVLADPQLCRPTAANVGRVAARRYAAGQRDDLWTLAPRYFRRSAAEEKWEARHGPEDPI
jgi:tRNA threonylcarbamoyladenosine biosynthesis protein TsaB